MDGWGHAYEEYMESMRLDYETRLDEQMENEWDCESWEESPTQIPENELPF